LWDLRLPRVCEAILVGALLACAGIALQGLLLNPLAEPYTLGVSAGAAVGVAIAELAGFAVMLGGLGSAVAGFVGATAAVSLVYRLARVRGRVSVEAALLAGVVVGTLLWSLIPLLLTLANRLNEQSRVLFYLIGSLQSADWTRVTLLAVVIVPVVLVLRMSSKELNLLSFGEEAALHLGVGVEGLKRRVLLIGSLATATVVAVAGAIGFVGLVTPHMARMLCGPDVRRCLPVAAVLGATMMVLSDLLCRVWLNEMPVGVVTSLVGAPVFCVLLRRHMSERG
jgi:iron complex transport system permease protein